MSVVKLKAGSLICILFEGSQTVVFPDSARSWVFGPEYADSLVGVLEEWTALAAEARVPFPGDPGEPTLLGADSSDYHVNPLEDERR